MRTGVASIVRGSALPALLFLTGCGGCSRDVESYPATFNFSPRQDPIVVDLPKNPPTELERNGELDEGIRRINERGGRALDPANVPDALKQDLTNYLAATFGTPAVPSINGDAEITTLAVNLGLTNDNLVAGSKLFRARCQECHGPDGDGRGRTAPWLTPHSRDFRQGAFKFTSTNGGGAKKPS